MYTGGWGWVGEASQIHLLLDGVAETFEASGVTICLTVKMCDTSFRNTNQCLGFYINLNIQAYTAYPVCGLSWMPIVSTGSC